jgi:hypothetical protein
MPRADVNGIDLEYVKRGSGIHLENPSGMAEGLAAFVARHASGLAA